LEFQVQVTTLLPHWGNFAPLALLVILFLPIKSVWMFDAAATLFLFPVVVYIASRLPENPRTDGFCIYLGELSYPLYVLHYPIVVAVSNAAHQFGMAGWRLSVTAFVCLVFIVAVAHISLNSYDKPIRKALTGRFRKREHARNYRTEGVST
jgi:peptidoglycan/LPS O-acetylase OafA/YrhL